MQPKEQSPDTPQLFSKNFLSGKTVLMIDADVEEGSLLKVSRHLLCDRGGATIVSCDTIQKALDYMKDAITPKPDLIWLGDMKEHLSGQSQFCQWAKRYNKDTKHIPLLVVSSLGMGTGEKQKAALLDIGADAVLRKASFSIDELSGTLEALLTPATAVTGERERAAMIDPDAPMRS